MKVRNGPLPRPATGKSISKNAKAQNKCHFTAQREVRNEKRPPMSWAIPWTTAKRATRPAVRRNHCADPRHFVPFRMLRDVDLTVSIKTNVGNKESGTNEQASQMESNQFAS